MPMKTKNQIAQDALRLHAWTDTAIAADLEGYPEVDPRVAGKARDRLLGWLQELARREDLSE